MLSPEFLDLIEFNEVVNLYTRLNIEITSDIIRRILKMNKISSATRYQLKKILQTGGTEVFNEVLEKTSLLTAEMKKELKNVFEEMAKEDIEGYKELYEYKGKPFKLSTEQYKILNQGLKETEHTLKNFTKSIAFESQQDYINAVDEVYNQIITGTFDYNTAMNRAAQKLADKGVTLKDKLGRNIQLEVAIRRNIMTSIHKTASTINRDIEDYLGCDGYEVSAHMGARPTHAEAQGKQYAKEHRTKISKKYPLWKEVEDLWQEYNCHHTYFGIILGISEPQHNKKELSEFKNAKVTLNGKNIPYYQATQKQRAKENKMQTLEKSGLDATTEKSKLRQMQKDLTSFCKETGLEKDYSRMKITS